MPNSAFYVLEKLIQAVDTYSWQSNDQCETSGARAYLFSGSLRV
jgi:hypothetical protein